MKNILILTVLSGLLFAGCMSDNLVSSDPAQAGETNLEWIQNSGNILKPESELTISKTINGNSGGRIIINERIGNIEITGSLTIPQGAYPGNQTISITFNDLNSYQVYTPSPYVFRIPLILNLVYRNINVSQLDPSKVAFYFQADNGVFYRAQYDSVIVDPLNQTLGITGARIPHFSRWGWAKDAETN